MSRATVIKSWLATMAALGGLLACTPLDTPKANGAEGATSTEPDAGGAGEGAAGTDAAQSGEAGQAGVGGMSESQAGATAEPGGAGAAGEAGAPSAGAGGEGQAGSNAGAAAGGGAPEAGASGGPAEPVCGNGAVEGSELCDGDCPTAEQCTSDNACLPQRLGGAANTCDARCETVEVTLCVKADGCCPAGCTYPDDDDCPKSCGDGVVDAPETCEPASTQIPCPVSCDDGMACTLDTLTGSARECTAKCSNLPITSARDGDDCCPTTANANNDDDCEPRCGNGVTEDGETCDRDCPRSCPRPSNACRVAELQGSGCQVTCVERELRASTSGPDGCCPSGANATTDSDCSPSCGNGVVESGELCDGNCPTSCRDPSADACVDAELEGTGCNRRCVDVRLGPSLAGADGCCPPGHDATTDSDCDPPRLLYDYATPCSGAPYSNCHDDSGLYVCHALGMCAPICNPDVACPESRSGHAPTCALLCQIHCLADAGCPAGMMCVQSGGTSICAYRAESG